MRLYTSRLEEDQDPYLMYCNFQGIASIVPKVGVSKPLYSCSHKRLLTGRGNLLWYIRSLFPSCGKMGSAVGTNDVYHCP